MKPIFLFGLIVITTCKVIAKPVPVMIGGFDNLDACTTLAIVSENTQLYSAPNDNQELILSIAKGTRFMVCDYAEGGWSGIVFGDGSPYCGLSSPVVKRQPYVGECESGWVKTESIEIIAG